MPDHRAHRRAGRGCWELLSGTGLNCGQGRGPGRKSEPGVGLGVPIRLSRCDEIAQVARTVSILATRSAFFPPLELFRGYGSGIAAPRHNWAVRRAVEVCRGGGLSW
jgi:hypothetical protein